MKIFASSAMNKLPNIQELRKLFIAWKSAEDPCSFFEFGLDVKSQVEFWRDFEELRHVHLAPIKTNGIPEDIDEYEAWDIKFNSKTRNVKCDGRKSDLLLFYAVYKGEYILLAQDSHLRFSRNSFTILSDIADKWVAARDATRLNNS